MDTPNYLELKLPPRAFLWPVVGGLCMAVNPFFSSLRIWHGHPIASVVLVFIGVLVGSIFTMAFLATQFVRLECVDGNLHLFPRKGMDRLPSWFTGLPLRGDKPGEGIILPISGTTLEWVGHTLILHHKGKSLRLGRGKVADQILAFLMSQGLANPLGR